MGSFCLSSGLDVLSGVEFSRFWCSFGDLLLLLFPQAECALHAGAVPSKYTDCSQHNTANNPCKYNFAPQTCGTRALCYFEFRSWGLSVLGFVRACDALRFGILWAWGP